MNRLRTSLLALLVVVSVPAAATAKDLTGRWGLGVSTVFGPKGLTGNSIPGAAPTAVLGVGMPGLSAKYAPNEKLAINFGLGALYHSTAATDSADAETNTDYTVGGRVLYNLVSESTGHFYLGGGAVVNLRSFMMTDSKMVRIPLTFGAEVFLSKNGSFAIHAEGGLEIGYYMPGGDMPRNETSISTVGGVFNVGFHWYFAAGGGGEESGE